MSFDIENAVTLAVVLHVLGLLAAIHAVVHTRTPQGAAAWAVALVSLPYIMLIPYLFLGRNRFKGYVEAHRRNRARWSATRDPRASRTDAEGEKLDDGCARHAGLCALLDTPFRPGHRLQLLIDGRTTFESMLGAIGGATEYVLVQFFILSDDRIGRRFQQALIERARAGVRVHVLYDGVGSHALPRSYIRALNEAGVRTHVFATRRWTHRLQVNFRNHRKIVVADGRIGFVGGLNVGDSYMGENPRLSPWRDTHLRVEGPVVSDLQRSFAEGWFWSTGENLVWHEAPMHDHGMSCLPAICGPADRQETCSLLFVALIQAARQRVWITTPYFVPDGPVRAALQVAVLRGVDVRILLPSRADHHAVFAVSMLNAYQMLDDGLRIYRYTPGFLHEKVVLIDEDTSMVGSMNLDSRSLRLNFEAGVITVDKGFAADVERMLQADFAHAEVFTSGHYTRLPMWRRVFTHLARLFDPIL